MKVTFIKFIFCFCITLITAFSVFSQEKGDVMPGDLRCCNRINPQGVDSPLLSWKIMSDAEGVLQSGWEVEIATTTELLIQSKADVWKSGRSEDTRLNSSH